MKKKRIIKTIKIILLIIVLLAGVKGVLVYHDYRAEQERLAQKPYFTKDKLTEHVMNVLKQQFHVKVTPSWRKSWDKKDWPDYSYYTIEATEDTEIVVTVMNYKLFDDLSEYNRDGFEKAKEYGFTTDNRLTVDWVMEHPNEAAEIMESMASDGADYINLFSYVYQKYETITGEVIDTEKKEEEWMEDFKEGYVD